MLFIEKYCLLVGQSLVTDHSSKDGIPGRKRKTPKRFDDFIITSKPSGKKMKK